MATVVAEVRPSRMELGGRCLPLELTNKRRQIMAT